MTLETHRNIIKDHRMELELSTSLISRFLKLCWRHGTEEVSTNLKTTLKLDLLLSSSFLHGTNFSHKDITLNSFSSFIFLAFLRGGRGPYTSERKRETKKQPKRDNQSASFPPCSLNRRWDRNWNQLALIPKPFITNEEICCNALEGAHRIWPETQSDRTSMVRGKMIGVDQGFQTYRFPSIAQLQRS